MAVYKDINQNDFMDIEIPQHADFVQEMCLLDSTDNVLDVQSYTFEFQVRYLTYSGDIAFTLTSPSTNLIIQEDNWIKLHIPKSVMDTLLNKKTVYALNIVDEAGYRYPIRRGGLTVTDNTEALPLGG